MCFSKEASYTAGALLVALGSYACFSTRQKRLIPTALVPIFFGIQQLAEGSLWADLAVGLPLQAGRDSISALIFLIFAFFIWPLWIPFATLLPEKVPARRTILKILLSLGFVVSVISVYLFKTSTVTATIVENSIQYINEMPLPLPYHLLLGLYATAIIAPFFVSTTKGFSLFGILSIISLIVSYYIYSNSFTSVWCFFSALISVVVLFIVKARDS